MLTIFAGLKLLFQIIAVPECQLGPVRAALFPTFHCEHVCNGHLIAGILRNGTAISWGRWIKSGLLVVEQASDISLS